MTSPKRKTVDAIADKLRQIVLAVEEGAFIGGEETLIAELACSRNTARQAARLLEREGLLRVRRGINGGYFGARPDAGTIEATVGTYLSRLDIPAEEVTRLASTLWVDAVRAAAATETAQSSEVLARLRKKIKSVKDTASFDTVRDIELETQSAIFDLTRNSYIKLIFDINAEFSRRRFTTPIRRNDTPEHEDFVRTWREAKLMELNAIAMRDKELAVMAARYSRRVWQSRVYSSDLTLLAS
jgi:DNA-binding FadR family transcriptional regulator